ncbi:IclR family transcriptional regulator [Pseudonocardia sp. H11422]|uniref:IclR family transcriptional regulator n=1 Tax=Pseudonocardia sp. H11422 TaxID=2835866 RepID=UPI002027A9DE|nr:IclR family transcriptional regulator [Pseudonocardia sp. H11422]
MASARARLPPVRGLAMGASMAGGSTQWRGRSVISKVVSLLDAFTPATRELSLGELAQITGLPVSTTYRLASELVAWGGLERAGSGAGYRIGMRLWELGTLAPPGETLRDVALPFMQDLCQATHESVHLAVLDGREALYVDTIAGRSAVPVRSRRGGRLPLHATGVGKVLLAHAPAALLEELLEAGLPRYTPRTVIAPAHLRRALAEVRRTGVAYAREEMSLGSLSVASPVVDGDGAVVAAMAVVLRAGHGDLRRLAPAVRTAAISTSRSLHERARFGGPLAVARTRHGGR